MARDAVVLRVKAAALNVELEHVRCQRLGLRPINTFRRHRGWIIPLCGFAAGGIVGSAAGRTTVSALLTTGFAAMRLQPFVARVLKIF